MNKVTALGTVVVTGMFLQPTVALACGGCFAPTETQTVVTDHRMVMAVHSTESILWDQIRYSGRPEDFSWVLPVAGNVRVELASGDFFQGLDETTAVQVRAPSVNLRCVRDLGTFSDGAEMASAGGNSGAVQVLHEEVVGPYQTVTLRSTDAGALTNWLRENRYAVPPSIEPVIQFYNDRHTDFVAMRLRPGEGISSMQPVRVRYATANMVLPLRMVAAGVADKVGITLWIFGQGRYEAANFANGTVSANDLVWDWSANKSNYSTVFTDTLNKLQGGRAWITEYSQRATNLRTAIVCQYGSGDLSSSELSNYRCGYRPPRADAGVDAGDGGTPTPTVREDWELATGSQSSQHGALDSNIWVTRIRTDLLARFLDADLVLQASALNQPVSNVLQVAMGHEVGPSPRPACFNPGNAGSTTGATGNTASVADGGTRSVDAATESIGTDGSVDGGGSAVRLRGGSCTAAPTSNRRGGLPAGILVSGLIVGATRRRRRRRASQRIA